MGLVILTVAVVAIVMLAMAAGVLMKRPCLRGSCGGPQIFDKDGESLTCSACPNRREASQRFDSTPDQASEPAGAGARRES
jgi:hypothetical protein